MGARMESSIMRRSRLAIVLCLPAMIVACATPVPRVWITDPGFLRAPDGFVRNGKLVIRAYYDQGPAWPAGLKMQFYNGDAEIYSPMLVSSPPGTDVREFEWSVPDGYWLPRLGRVYWLNPDGSKVRLEVEGLEK